MTKYIRWSGLVAIVGCILALALVLYGQQNLEIVPIPPTRLAPDYGGTYTEGIAGSPQAPNPLMSRFNDTDADIASLIFSGLTKLGKDGRVVPDLAESWQISQDGRSYVFNLRRDVKWHDGEPFTAAGVAFTVQVMQNPDFDANPELSRLWKNVKCEKIDDYSIKLSLAEPYAPFLAYTTIGILPAHQFKGTLPKDVVESSLNARPVGTGPFKVKEFTISHLLLEYNPDYYLGRPYLDAIDFKFFHDYQTALAALEQRQVDGTLLRPVVSREVYKKLEQNKDLNLHVSHRSSYALIFLNDKSPLFSQKEMRKALLYAIDRKGIIEGPLAGQGLIADSPIVANTWGFNGEISKYTFSPEEAGRTLDSLGWSAKEDGVRQKDGQKLQFTLLTNDDPMRKSIGNAITRQLKDVGVEANLSIKGASDLVQNFLIPRAFDAVLYGWDTGYDPDCYPAWHSSQINENGFNFASYANPQIDKLLEEARQTNDNARRLELYRQFQERFGDEIPSLLLYYPSYTYAVNKNVKGIELGVLFNPSSRFTNVKDWYINTKRVEIPEG